MRAKNLAPAILSRAGTMVWLSVIVIAVPRCEQGKMTASGSVISRVPLGRPLTGALTSGRATPSLARISGEPTGTASGLAALGDRHADRTAGGLPLRLMASGISWMRFLGILGVH